jgi:DNA gyrase subunit A
VPPTHAVAVTSDGYTFRFGFGPYAEPSTRTGRRYARPSGQAEVVGVSPVQGGEVMIAATEQARAILCKVEEINYLSGPGKGVILIS